MDSTGAEVFKSSGAHQDEHNALFEDYISSSAPSALRTAVDGYITAAETQAAAHIAVAEAPAGL